MDFLHFPRVHEFSVDMQPKILKFREIFPFRELILITHIMKEIQNRVRDQDRVIIQIKAFNDLNHEIVHHFLHIEILRFGFSWEIMENRLNQVLDIHRFLIHDFLIIFEEEFLALDFVLFDCLFFVLFNIVQEKESMNDLFKFDFQSLFGEIA